MPFQIAVAPQVVADLKCFQGGFIENGEILSGDKVLDQILLLLTFKVFSRFDAYRASFALRAIPVYELDGRHTHGLGISDIIRYRANRIIGGWHT